MPPWLLRWLPDLAIAMTAARCGMPIVLGGRRKLSESSMYHKQRKRMKTVGYGVILFRQREGQEIELLGATEDTATTDAVSAALARELALGLSKYIPPFRLVPIERDQAAADPLPL